MLAAAYVLVRGGETSLASDYDQLWVGVRTLAQGRNPYQIIGPGLEFEWDYLYYPLPALLLLSPLALLPVLAARAVLAAICAGLLAFAVTRQSRSSLLMFLSAPMFIALGRGQLSPLLLAAAFLPALAWVGVAKPNIAIAVLPIARPVRRAVISALIGGGILLVASFIVMPNWLSEWRRVIALREAPLTPVLLRAGGFGILLALARWRRPEAWMLVLLGSVPGTTSFYDAVPLFAIPRGWRQVASLAIAGNVAFLLFLATLAPAPGAGPAMEEGAAAWALVFLYLPCVWLILRRPNAATDERVPDVPPGWKDAPLMAGVAFSAFFVLWASLVRYHA